MGQVVEPAVCDPQSEQSLTALITLASDSANWTERDARYFIDKIEQLEAAATWPRKLKGEPKTWKRFCDEVLGYDAGYVEKIREGLSFLENVGVKSATIGQAMSVGQYAGQAVPQATLNEAMKGNQNSRISKNSNYNINADLTNSKGGDSSEYLTARIARDRPDILEDMQAGKYKSVRAAALDAGIVRPRFTVPADDVRAIARALVRHLTIDQIEELTAILTGND